MSDPNNGANNAEEPDVPEEPEESPQAAANNRRALEVVAIAAVIVVVTTLWVIYVVNPTWLTYCLAIGVPLVTSLLVYRFRPSLVSESVLLAINTVLVWAVYFPHPNLAALLVGVLMLVLVLRNILQYIRGTEREAILESFRKVEAPVRINDRLALKLNPNERYKIVTHYHVVSVQKWFVAMMAWLVICILILTNSDAGVLPMLGIFAAGELLLGVKVLLWRHELLCVTTHYRLFEMRGIMEKSTPTISVQKLTDTTPIITRLSTVLSWLRIIKAPYGYYVLESSGQDQALTRIGPIPNVNAFERVLNQMVTPRANEGPLE